MYKKLILPLVALSIILTQSVSAGIYDNTYSCYNFNKNVNTVYDPLRYKATYKTSKDIDALQQMFYQLNYVNSQNLSNMSIQQSVLDETTSNLLKEFQTDYGIPETGLLDTKTRKVLNSMFSCQKVKTPTGVVVKSFIFDSKTYKRAYVGKIAGSFWTPELKYTMYMLDGQNSYNYSDLVTIYKYTKTSNYNKPKADVLAETEAKVVTSPLDADGNKNTYSIVTPLKKVSEGVYTLSYLDSTSENDPVYIIQRYVQNEENVFLYSYAIKLLSSEDFKNSAKVYVNQLAALDDNTSSQVVYSIYTNYIKSTSNLLTEKESYIQSRFEQSVLNMPKDQDVYKKSQEGRDLRN